MVQELLYCDPVSFDTLCQIADKRKVLFYDYKEDNCFVHVLCYRLRLVRMQRRERNEKGFRSGL